MIDIEKEKVRDFLVEWTSCYCFCFCEQTPDRWKEIFISKRLEMFLEINRDLFEEVTKISLESKKNMDEFKKIYKELFMEEINNYVTELKKTKDEELKQEIRTKGVRRKVETPSKDNKKKKNKKK